MNSLPHGKISQGRSTPPGQICPGTEEIATIKTDQGHLHGYGTGFLASSANKSIFWGFYDDTPGRCAHQRRQP
jgi:hypothetical protein